ncbi:hypothetical protein [Desulfoscipio sp. XC116]|uniref:hypothetical protein n=1 Tax=Desulfoscipio sp. XC116 TaxID=3144975 RepID=UPI00325B4E4A
MDNDKIEHTLVKILEYRSEHKVDDDSILIMLSLLNLMGMVNVLNRDEDSGSAASAGPGGVPGNMEALLGPLIALMAAGMGKGGGAGGGQGSFNPAALLSLLGGVQGKGGIPDLSALFSLLGPLMGMGGAGQPPGRTGGGNNESAAKSQPVQREINLDKKYKTSGTGTENGGERTPRKEKKRPPKPGEVLKWKFGT